MNVPLYFEIFYKYFIWSALTKAKGGLYIIRPLTSGKGVQQDLLIKFIIKNYNNILENRIYNTDKIYDIHVWRMEVLLILYLLQLHYGQTYYVLFHWTPYNISALEKLYFEYR